MGEYAVKIFISWSGDASRHVAELLREWIPNVIQEIEPFVSSQDISKGERGMDRIGQNLSETDFGIVCLTEANIAAPWINFEAGALSKSVTRSHVIPLLCGMNQIDVANSPLRQFQYAQVNEDEMRRVVADINANCGKPLSSPRLESAFDTWWPVFIDAYNQMDFASGGDVRPSDENSRLGRIETAVEVIMSDMKRLRRESRLATRKLGETDGLNQDSRRDKIIPELYEMMSSVHLSNKDKVDLLNNYALRRPQFTNDVANMAALNTEDDS